MTEATRCNHCGANLGPGDLDRPACPYCKTTHPHVAQARRQVEGLRQVFGQGGMPGMMGMMPPPGAPGQPGAPSPWQHQMGQPPMTMPNHVPMQPPPRGSSTAASIAIGVVAVVLGFFLRMFLRNL